MGDEEPLLRKRVVARMDALGMNAFALARDGKFERNFVNDLLNGKKETVQAKNLTKLAKVLRCSVEYLIEKDAPEPPDPEPEGDEPAPANHLRAWREHAGLSEAQLGQRAGSSEQVIKDLEGSPQPPSPKWLRTLAPLLRTTPGHLRDFDPADIPADVLEAWTDIPESKRSDAMAMLRALSGGRS